VSVVSETGRAGARVIESIYPRLLSESREEEAITLFLRERRASGSEAARGESSWP
jgi:hypothetical protein